MNPLKKLLIIAIALPFLYSCEGHNIFNKAPSNKLVVGMTAHELLSGEEFTVLEIEIISMDGEEVLASSKTHVKQFLEGIINKPEGIEFYEKSIPAQGKSKYSISDIKKIEDDNRTRYNRDHILAVTVVCLDGGSSSDNGNSLVLGSAYRNTSIVLFQENIKASTGGVLQPTRALAEQAVLDHEFGHILGLVNIGSPMQESHQDAANGHHCIVEECLMYYALETSDFLNSVLDGGVPPLDAQCKADLKANGGK